MNKEELTELAQAIAGAVYERIVSLIKNNEFEDEEFVNSNRAAKILGISRTYLLQNRDKYPHVKKGDKKQCRVYFRKADLIKSLQE